MNTDIPKNSSSASVATNDSVESPHHTQNNTTRQATPKQWENLANEAIADSGYWKREARNAQGQRDLLLRAARLAQSVIGGADTSGAGQRAAHAALFVALANCDASNLNNEAKPIKGKDRPTIVMGAYRLNADLTLASNPLPRLVPGQDSGADPIGNGQFRMFPSGDIVNLAERNLRLNKANTNTATN